MNLSKSRSTPSPQQSNPDPESQQMLSITSINASMPQIHTGNRHLRNITSDALEAMSRANKPPIWFIRAGELVRVKVDEEGRPSFELLNIDSLRGILERSANFIRGPKESPCPPPNNVIRDILSLGKWGFPPLVGIVECPVLRPNGTVLSHPGYDPATRLFLHPDLNLQMETIPDFPSEIQISQSLTILNNMIADFPFMDESSRTNALALLMTPILRPAIEGNVPLALITAPQPGTGKTLLSKLVSLIATGQVDNLTTAPKTSEEWRKKITSILVKGSSVVILDNLSGKLDSDDLSAVLTTPRWTDRLLGRNKMISLPHYAVWIANGNNIRLGGDLSRRCYLIQLVTNSSRPWARDSFTIPDLEKWVLENRGQLIRAILILARAWFADGSPVWSGQVMGGFTSWTNTVGGILHHVGVHGFLENLNIVYESIDEEGTQWESFLLSLHERFCGQMVSTRQICEALVINRGLADLIPNDIDYALDNYGNLSPSFPRKLGMILRKIVDVRYGATQVRVTEAPKDKHHNVARWKIVCGECGSCGS